MPGTPCLLFAVRRESMFFRRDCGSLRPLPATPCGVFVGDLAGRSLRVLETGIGRSAVDDALDWILGEAMPPRFLVYAGFAGALDASVRVGDVLLADEVVDEAGRHWPRCWPAATVGIPPWIRRGRLLTAAHLVTTPEAKQRLGVQHHARAVDMEAAYVAQRCAARNVPFGCVRAVSDAVDVPLSSSLLALMSGGHVSLPRVIAALMRKPMLLPELLRLGRDSRRAARQLAAAVRELLVLAERNWPADRQNGLSGGCQEGAAGLDGLKTRENT
jgi:adenosylhomocysteine nucleosidase